MMTSFVTRVAALTGLLLLQWTACAFGQGISVERVQRDFQVRYHQITGNYVEWPKCSAANATPAPLFPKDGFYGNLLLDPDKGVELVKDLVQKFYGTTTKIYPSFVKSSDNGYGGLEELPDIVNLQDSDMQVIVDTDVTTATYVEKLQLLKTQMAKLTLLKVEATQVIAPDQADSKVSWSGYHAQSTPTFTCESVQDCTIVAHAAADWGDFSLIAVPPNCVSYSHIPIASVDNSDQYAVALFAYPAIECVLETMQSPGWLGIGYPCAVRNTRGKIQADLTGYKKGEAKIFLKLTRPSCDYAFNYNYWSAVYLGLDEPKTPPSCTTAFSTFGESTPTSAAENTYGIWAEGTLALGKVSTSGYVTGSDIPPPLGIGSCDIAVAASYGWTILGAWVIVQPDFTTVPDSQDCCSCIDCEPGELTASVQSLHVDIPLGSDNFGGSAGALALSADLPSPALATLAALRYSVASTVVAVPEISGRRQFKTSQALFDLQVDAVNPDYKYSISVYSAGNFSTTPGVNGFYPPTGPAASTTVIENPDASSTVYNRLRLTRTKGGNSTVTDYVYTAGTGNGDGEWQMITGGGLRKESRNSTWAGDIRTETVIIRNSADQIVSKEINTYKKFPWGQERTKYELEATSSGPALTSSWTYYDDAVNDGGNYSRLKEQVGAYGNWVRYEYDTNGRETKRVSQLGNTAVGSAENLNRVVTTSYATTDPQITTVETLLGQEVSRRYQVVHSGEVRTIVCQTPGAGWNTAADNLVTITKKHTSGTFKDELQSVENPDGTMQLYTYDINISSGQRTDMVESGTPNGAKDDIIDGVRIVTVKGSVGQLVSRTVTDIVSGLTLSTEIYSNFDEFNRPQRVTHLDGTYEDTIYACCGIESTTDRDGVVTQYLYDDLKRQDGFIRHGITLRNTLDAEGRVLSQKRTGTDASQIILGQTTYDVAGRISTEVNGLNGTTTYVESFSSGQRVRTTTYPAPDSGTRIETYNKDGTLQKVTGSAVFAVRYEYDIETSGVDSGKFYTKQIKLQADQVTDSQEWTKTYTDAVGRSCKTIYADATTGTETDNPFIQSFYNNKGQLVKSVDQDGVTTLFQYNAKGELEYTAVDLNTSNTTMDGNGNFSIDLNVDRVVQTYNDVIHTAVNGDIRRSTSFIYPTQNSDVSSLLTRQIVSTGGLRSQQFVRNTTPTLAVVSTISETVFNNNDGVTAAGYRTTTTTLPDSSKSVSVFYQGRLISTAQKDSSNGQLTKTSYTYDAHGRLWKTTDARNGTTTVAYNNADLITTATTPAPGIGEGAQTTTTFYDTALRAWKVTHPDGASVYNDFLPSGLLENTYGSRNYPVQYSYDYAGRLETMTTWKDFNESTGLGMAGAAVTTWYYNPARGWLEKKVYAGETDNTLDYEYKASGRLWKRYWERGVTATYSYNVAGDLETVAYSNDPLSTPGVGYTYDRRGRAKTITQGTTTTTLAFNDINEPLTEAYTGGPLNGLTVTRGYDNYLRRNSLSLNSQPSTINISYGYDPLSGRLQTVSDGTQSATYGYLANSPLVNTVTLKQNTTTRLTTTKSYDLLNRLTSISSANSQLSYPISYGYAYNSANQRKRNTSADGTYWNYDYDDLGQVKRGAKYFSDGNPVPGQQFEYAHDDIGNRTGTKAGGDENGANLRSTSYTADSLNQYDSRTVPRRIDVMGLALGTAGVTVTSPNAQDNAPAPWRKGEYFRKELSYVENTTPFWENLTITATAEANVAGNVFLPGTPEAFDHDDDGNLTSDGRWTYEWDAENRLKVMRSLTGSPAPERRLVFEYDTNGRRIRKTVWNDRDDGQGSEVSDTAYVYDGWNLIAELDANNANAVKNSFMWGTDLTGSLHGAGGVGGLLAVNNSIQGVHFCAYDGNGNMATLVKATDGTVGANYEYGPFGETIRATGLMASANPFRFSTKYQDDETDLLYYGYRIYNLITGRWLSRDPVSETGGLNVYQMLMNDLVNRLDLLGLYDIVGGLNGTVVNYNLGKNTNFHPPLELGIAPVMREVTYRSYRLADGTVTPLSAGDNLLSTGARLEEMRIKREETGDHFAYVRDLRVPSVLSNPDYGVPSFREVDLVQMAHNWKTQQQIEGLLFMAELTLYVDGIGGILDTIGAKLCLSRGRAAILADNDLLVNAFRGNENALAEIQAGKTFVTTEQLLEFLKVQEATARSAFLKKEGVEILTGAQISQFSGQAGVEAFTPTYNAIVGAQGRADATLAAFARSTGIEAVTMDRRLFNFITQSRKDSTIPIRLIKR